MAKSSQPKGQRAPSQARKKRKRQNRKKTIVLSPARGLSPCALAYLIAIHDPWNVDELPCIPDSITNPSFKFMTRGRGTFVTGTNGVGFVSVAPTQMFHSDTSTSGGVTTAAIAYTSNAYTASNFAWNITSGTPTTGVSVTNPNSPFTTSNLLSNTNKVRLVACGLRVRYIGTELNLGGRILPFRNRTNNPIPGMADGGTGTLAKYLQDPSSLTTPVKRGWTSINYRATDSVQTAYNSILVLTAPDYFSMGFFVDSVGISAGVSFEYDVVAFHELIGDLANNTTPSPSDPSGLAAAVGSVDLTMPEGTSDDGYIRRAGNYLRDNISGAAQYAGGTVAAGVGAYVANKAMKAGRLELRSLQRRGILPI